MRRYRMNYFDLGIYINHLRSYFFWVIYHVFGLLSICLPSNSDCFEKHSIMVIFPCQLSIKCQPKEFLNDFEIIDVRKHVKPVGIYYSFLLERKDLYWCYCGEIKINFKKMKILNKIPKFPLGWANHPYFGWWFGYPYHRHSELAAPCCGATGFDHFFLICCPSRIVRSHYGWPPLSTTCHLI